MTTHTTYQGLLLKTHFDGPERRIWYVDDKEAHAFPHDIRQFAAMLLEERPAGVKVLGLPSNAELIYKLYDIFSLEEQAPKLLVGTPAVCSRQDRHQPLAVLRRMEKVNTRLPSVGGWHEVTGADAASYRLVHVMNGNNGELTHKGTCALLLHPAYRALTFLNDLYLPSTANMLADIVDPRWFVDPKYPDRRTKLVCYLGLTRQNVKAICLEDGKPGFNAHRARHAMLAWQATSPMFAESSGGYGHFLHRCCSAEDDLVSGILKATNLFVRFVCSNWLRELASHPEMRAVDPDLFSDDWEEYRAATSEAFETHMGS